MADQSDPRDDQIVDWLRTHSGNEPTVDVDAAWSRFSARHEVGTPVTVLRRRKIPTIWRIAAVIVAVAGGAAVWRGVRNSPSSAPVTREVFALNGQRTNVTL